MVEQTRESFSPFKKAIQTAFNYLGDIFKPILPAITAAGMMQGLVILLVVVGWVDEASTTYLVLNAISQLTFYFLPLLVGLSAAHLFDVNPYLALAVLFFMFYPDLLALFEQDPPVRLFGIPLFKASYANSVFPPIIIVWFQKYVEQFAYRVIPEFLYGIVAPLLILLVTALAAIKVLGPLGLMVSMALGEVLKALGQIAHWLVPTLLGGLGIFAVMTGAHYPLFPLMLEQLAHQGYEDFFAAGMMATNIALAGSVLAILLRSSDPKEKSYGFSAMLTALLGTSQPAIYGFALKYKSALVGSVIAGFIGGFLAAFLNVVSYGYVNPGLAALPVYIAPDGDFTNVFNSLLVMGVSFVIAFIYTYQQAGHAPYLIEKSKSQKA